MCIISDATFQGGGRGERGDLGCQNSQVGHLVGRIGTFGGEEWELFDGEEWEIFDGEEWEIFGGEEWELFGGEEWEVFGGEE